MIDLSFLVIGALLFLRILSFLIITRVILSWVAPGSASVVMRFVSDTTEIILGPLRRAIPRSSGAFAMVDWSPLIALLLIDLLRSLIVAWL